MIEMLKQMICDYNTAKIRAAKYRVAGSAERQAMYEGQAYIASTYISKLADEEKVKIEVYAEEQIFFDDDINEIKRDVKQIRIVY